MMQQNVKRETNQIARDQVKKKNAVKKTTTLLGFAKYAQPRSHSSPRSFVARAKKIPR